MNENNYSLPLKAFVRPGEYLYHAPIITNYSSIPLRIRNLAAIVHSHRKEDGIMSRRELSEDKRLRGEKGRFGELIDGSQLRLWDGDRRLFSENDSDWLTLRTR